MGAAAAIAHANALGGDFVYDDGLVLGEAPFPQTLANLPYLFSPEKYFPDARELSWRPTVTLSHMVDLAISRDAVWHHLANVGLHAAAAVLLFRVAIGFGWGRLGALFAALFFAVHPVACETISVVTFREDLLAAVLLFSATLLVIPKEAAASPGRMVGAGALVFAACGAKEVSFAYPFAMIAAALVLPLAPGDGESRGARLRRWTLPGLAGFLLFFILQVSVFSFGKEAGDLGWVGHPGGSPLSAALTMLWVVARYARIVLFPHHLSVDWNPAAVSGLADPRALAGLGVLATLAGATALLWRRSPRAATGLLLAGCFVAPVLDIVPLPNIMAERYVYLPLAGAALALGIGAEALSAGGRRRAVLAASAVLLGLLAVRSHLRHRDFRDDRTLWTTTQRDCPESFRAPQMMGRFVGLEPPAPEAVRDRAAKIRERFGERKRLTEDEPERLAFVELQVEAKEREIALRRKGIPIAPPWSPEGEVGEMQLAIALRELGEAIQQAYQGYDFAIHHLVTLEDEARTLGATDAIGTIVSLRQALSDEAFPLRQRRDGAWREAIGILGRVAARIPKVTRTRAYENLSACHGLLGEMELAREYAEKGLAIQPKHASCLFNLGVYWQKRAEDEGRDPGRRQEWLRMAEAKYEQTVQADALFAPAYVNLFELRKKRLPVPVPGRAEGPQGPEVRDLLHLMREAVRVLPRGPDGRQNLDFQRRLGMELSERKQLGEAREVLRAALERDDQWADGWFMLRAAWHEPEPDGVRGDPRMALEIMKEAKRRAEPALRKRYDPDREIAGLEAGIEALDLRRELAAQPPLARFFGEKCVWWPADKSGADFREMLRWLRDHPEDVRRVVRLGLAFERQPDYEAALDSAKLALEADFVVAKASGAVELKERLEAIFREDERRRRLSSDESPVPEKLDEARRLEKLGRYDESQSFLDMAKKQDEAEFKRLGGDEDYRRAWSRRKQRELAPGR
ncbi:MAG: DUF1736 domain-containing protein [Planctomycetales bacterium]|nr:DUF1736 domain-containing protein [Planctomycetales bacterium]